MPSSEIQPDDNDIQFADIIETHVNSVMPEGCAWSMVILMDADQMTDEQKPEGMPRSDIAGKAIVVGHGNRMRTGVAMMEAGSMILREFQG